MFAVMQERGGSRHGLENFERKALATGRRSPVARTEQGW